MRFIPGQMHNLLVLNDIHLKIFFSLPKGLTPLAISGEKTYFCMI